jgi:hypothetical protein
MYVHVMGINGYKEALWNCHKTSFFSLNMCSVSIFALYVEALICENLPCVSFALICA